MENKEPEQLPAEKKKTTPLRKLEIFLLYMCLPAALIPLFYLGLKQLLMRRPPASAWVLLCTGIVLVTGWVVYLIARKKPFTLKGFLIASFTAACIFTPLQATMRSSHSAYPWITAATGIAIALFLGAVVYWLIRHPNILRYIVIMALSLTFMYLIMTSVTELVYGKMNNKTILRFVAAAGIVLLIRLPDIIGHFRKKAQPEDEETPDQPD